MAYEGASFIPMTVLWICRWRMKEGASFIPMAVLWICRWRMKVHLLFPWPFFGFVGGV